MVQWLGHWTLDLRDRQIHLPAILLSHGKLLLLRLFNGLSFQDNLGKPAPEKQNHSGKTNLDLLEQEIVSGSGISWAVCKSAPCSRQITMPAPHHLVFYRPDALSATQPTASKH